MLFFFDNWKQPDILKSNNGTVPVPSLNQQDTKPITRFAQGKVGKLYFVYRYHNLRWIQGRCKWSHTSTNKYKKGRDSAS
jgi:hypothetical protein